MNINTNIVLIPRRITVSNYQEKINKELCPWTLDDKNLRANGRILVLISPDDVDDCRHLIDREEADRIKNGTDDFLVPTAYKQWPAPPRNCPRSWWRMRGFIPNALLALMSETSCWMSRKRSCMSSRMSSSLFRHLPDGHMVKKTLRFMVILIPKTGIRMKTMRRWSSSATR